MIYLVDNKGNRVDVSTVRRIGLSTNHKATFVEASEAGNFNSIIDGGTVGTPDLSGIYRLVELNPGYTLYFELAPVEGVIRLNGWLKGALVEIEEEEE